MNIYIGNLSYDAVEDEIREAFENYGEVTSVNIIKDKSTGQSRGFGFVEMPTKEQAEAAITELNGQEFHGRALKVNEARPRAERSERNRAGGKRRY
jgi:RNA recognition motif-containing protein